MAENFKKNIGSLGSKDSPSSNCKYNVKQKFVFAKLISTSAEENFQSFCLKHQKFRIYLIRALSQQFSAGLSKLHFTCPVEHFATKKEQKNK